MLCDARLLETTSNPPPRGCEAESSNSHKGKSRYWKEIHDNESWLNSRTKSCVFVIKFCNR